MKRGQAGGASVFETRVIEVFEEAGLIEKLYDEGDGIADWVRDKAKGSLYAAYSIVIKNNSLSVNIYIEKNKIGDKINRLSIYREKIDDREKEDIICIYTSLGLVKDK